MKRRKYGSGLGNVLGTLKVRHATPKSGPDQLSAARALEGILSQYSWPESGAAKMRPRCLKGLDPGGLVGLAFPGHC